MPKRQDKQLECESQIKPKGKGFRRGTNGSRRNSKKIGNGVPWISGNIKCHSLKQQDDLCLFIRKNYLFSLHKLLDGSWMCDRNNVNM